MKVKEKIEDNDLYINDLKKQKINQINVEINELETKKNDLIILKDLLFETGRNLEIAVSKEPNRVKLDLLKFDWDRRTEQQKLQDKQIESKKAWSKLFGEEYKDDS